MEKAKVDIINLKIIFLSKLFINWEKICSVYCYHSNIRMILYEIEHRYKPLSFFLHGPLIKREITNFHNSIITFTKFSNLFCIEFKDNTSSYTITYTN